MIFSQYRETYEVMEDYPIMGGGNVNDFSKQAIRNLLHKNSCVHIRILIAEFPEDGIKCLENCSHIVKILLLQIKVGMIEISSKLHIKEGNQPSITSKDFRMHRHCQFQ